MSEQKTALVTGASKGIGKACAVALSQQGYRVAIHYRSGEQEARELASQIDGAELFKADLTDEGQSLELVKSVKASMGRIDVLVNNAGASRDQLVTFAKKEDFDFLMKINLQSTFLLCKATSRVMIKQKVGSIVNVTSVVGHTGNAGQSIYAASKGAVTAMTKSMAMELAQFGIRVNCVAPGFIKTAMTDSLPDTVKEKILGSIPLGRMGEADEVAKAVSYLASADGSYITGTTLHINGGMYCG